MAFSVNDIFNSIRLKQEKQVIEKKRGIFITVFNLVKDTIEKVICGKLELTR